MQLTGLQQNVVPLADFRSAKFFTVRQIHCSPLNFGYGVTTGLSERAIGRALKVSRTAVAKYLECFRGSGLTWEQAQELPDSELLAVLEGQRVTQTSARYEQLAERFPTMVKELRRNGVTLQLLWEEYLSEHPDGYQNSQFCHHFHPLAQEHRGEHAHRPQGGEKLFVDYAGDKLVIVDPDGGTEQPVERSWRSWRPAS